MKVGDRVIISSTEPKFMTQWREEADSAIGIIDKIGSGPDWPWVQFPNGYRNTYRERDLELVDRKPTLDASAEYYEIIAAQELMEEAK